MFLVSLLDKNCLFVLVRLVVVILLSVGGKVVISVINVLVVVICE